MKVPGLAWLELRASRDGDGSRYDQRAVFFPQGLAGRLYWLAVLPFHGFIFRGMANRIAAAAEAEVDESDRWPPRPDRIRPSGGSGSDDPALVDPHRPVDETARHRRRAR